MADQEIKISLFGGIEVRIDGISIPLPKSKKARAIFAYLAAELKPINKTRLCDIFFSDVVDPKGNLRSCLYQLRRCGSGEVKSVLCSNAENIWVDLPRMSIDIHRLHDIQKNKNVNKSDIEFLENVTQHIFLRDLYLAHENEFELWQSTLQVHYENLKEKILEEKITLSLGSRFAVKLAFLFIKFAPHSERAWYLLVVALGKIKNLPEAKYFLKKAHEQLNNGQVLQTGLLALAAKELKKLEKPINCIANHEILENPVLPFLAISTLKENDPIHEAVHDAIFTTAIAEKSFSLLSPDTSPNGHEQIGNVDFILTPSIKKFNTEYQLNLQLTENISKRCIHNWRSNFKSEPLERMMFAIKHWLGVLLEIELAKLMVLRASKKPPATRTAVDYYYLALPRIYSPVGYSPQSSLELLRKSLHLDANFAPALCAYTWVKSTHPLYNEKENERSNLAKMSRRAIELAYDNAFIQSWAAITVGHMECNPEAGLAFSKHALELHPYSPMSILAAALMSHYTGEYQQSLNYLKKIQGQNIEPLTFIEDTCYSLNYYQLGKLRKAIKCGQKAVSRNPGYIVALRVLTASLARSGNLDEAKIHAHKMLAIDPSEKLSYFKAYSPYSDKAALTQLCQDLKLSGINK